MIDLTPLDVRKKKDDLPQTFRGYDKGHVDDFLDLVAERMEQLVRQCMELGERVETLEEQLRGYKERERSLSDALMSAQELREDAKRYAEREAELARREAEAAASRITQAAVEARDREAEQLRRLRAEQKQFVKSFRAFLERELADLAVAEEALRLRDEAADSGGSEKRPPARESQRGAKSTAAESIPEPAQKAAGGGEVRQAADGSPKGGATADGTSQSPGEPGSEAEWLRSILEEEGG